MLLNRLSRFAWLFWTLLYLCAIKPSVVFLTYAIPACFIDYNVSSVSLYRLFGSAAAGIVFPLFCAALVAFATGMALIVARFWWWKAIGILLLVLQLPFQFEGICYPPNLCFGGGNKVTMCHGEVAGMTVKPMPNNRIMAVKLEGIGYPPYAIFNGFDINGVSREQIGEDYLVEVWMTDAARFRLSRILSKYKAIGYLVINGGEMHYVNGVDGCLQRDGMYYIGYCGESVDKASDFMFMVDLAPVPDSNEVMNGWGDLIVDDDSIFCGGRVMNLDSFIAKGRVKDCGQMIVRGNDESRIERK